MTYVGLLIKMLKIFRKVQFCEAGLVSLVLFMGTLDGCLLKYLCFGQAENDMLAQAGSSHR